MIYTLIYTLIGLIICIANNTDIINEIKKEREETRRDPENQLLSSTLTDFAVYASNIITFIISIIVWPYLVFIWAKWKYNVYKHKKK